MQALTGTDHTLTHIGPRREAASQKTTGRLGIDANRGLRVQKNPVLGYKLNGQFFFRNSLVVSLNEVGGLFLKKCSHYKPWLIAKQNKQKQKTRQKMSTGGTQREGQSKPSGDRGGETGQTHKMPPPWAAASSLCRLLFLSKPWSE